MQQNYAESLLRSGIIEAKAGQKDVARRYLERVLYTSDNNQHEVMAEAWFWMAQVSDDPAEKHRALENALSHDLRHARARRALAILDGKIKPEDVVDPDDLPQAHAGIVQAEADRFMCPKCGGRMSFTPDGQALVCEYCTRRQTLGAGLPETREQDFIVAMATLRGHGKPLAEHVFHCEGCGAEFILPPTLVSSDCLYCGSPHVVKVENIPDLIAPDAVLPHAFDQKRASLHLAEWLKHHKIGPDKQMEPPRGLYLPVWTFDLGGEIKYLGTMIQQEGRLGGKAADIVRIEDSYPVQMNDLAIPASRKLARLLASLLPTFNLREMKPYQAKYLANWPAEMYDVPMGDASLDARSQAFGRIKRELPTLLEPIKILSTSSQDMTVESFKLALLPVWLANLNHDSPDETVIINGQNGVVAGGSPKRESLLDRLSDLFND